jgi:hypothetical protein
VTPAPAPAQPAAGGRDLLSAAVDLPSRIQLPTGSVSVQVPLPDPVTVTGEVSTPAPGEVRIEVRVTAPDAPAGRHVADSATVTAQDPAGTSTPVDAVDGLLDRVARHRAPSAP